MKLKLILEQTGIYNTKWWIEIYAITNDVIKYAGTNNSIWIAVTNNVIIYAITNDLIEYENTNNLINYIFVPVFKPTNRNKVKVQTPISMSKLTTFF